MAPVPSSRLRKTALVRVSLAVAAFAVISTFTAARGEDFEAGAAPENSMAGMSIDKALRQNTKRLMSVAGVVGVAVGECSGKPCILVLVTKKTPELRQKIPSVLEGYPVVVEETGPIRPLDRG